MNKLIISNQNNYDETLQREFSKVADSIANNYTQDRVIAITSCKDKEGKSLLALQTAIELARRGYRILLLMNDFRKILASKEKTLDGFFEVVKGTVGFENVLYETDVAGLYMVFAGGNEDTLNEKIDDNLFGEIIEYLKQQYHYIIIDTPTVGKNINDTVIFSKCDVTIIVMTTNNIPKKLAKKTINKIEQTGCSVMGVVLNNKP